MRITPRALLGAAALLVLGLGIGRAALLQFQERARELQRLSREEGQKSGLSPAQLKAKYPTPEISLVSSGCLLANSTAEVVVKGKFSPGTKFVIENDNIEVVKESLTGGEYRATVKAADGIGPQTAAVMAIAPGRGQVARSDRGIKVGGKYEFTLEASNGWRVVARSPAAKACPDTAGEDAYEVLFFRKGEAKEFEKRSGKLYFNIYDRQNFRLSVDSGGPAAGSAQAEMAEVTRKFNDPSLSMAQREQLMKRMESLQQRLIAEMQQMTNPANIKKMEDQRKEFGCENINLEVGAGAAKGEMRCAEKVGRLAVTGTLKSLGR